MAGLEGTFDGSEVYLTVGPSLITGFSDGDSITATKSANFYEYKVGLHGTAGRARNTDKSGTIEIHLLQTSLANDDISSLLNLDSTTADGKLVFPISVMDFSGRTVIWA